MPCIYIRPLRVEDGLISYKWRNDEEIWRLTGASPPGEVTPEIEVNWYKSTLQNANEKKFAICLEHNDKYIGNIQLTSVTEHDAEYHIFIGEKLHWGKGYAQQSTRLLIEIARHEYKLRRIYLYVNPENKAAIRVYEKLGFIKTSNEIKMTLDLL